MRSVPPPEPGNTELPARMKILIDFLPILLFFGAYKFYDIYVATGTLMVATVWRYSKSGITAAR